MAKPKAPEFGLPKRVATEYEAAIGKIVRRMLPPKLPEQTLTQWLEEIARRQQAAEIREASELLAQRMVAWVNDVNAKTWRQAAERSSKSRQLYGLLVKEMSGPVGSRVRQLVRENANYISSIPLHAATILTREVSTATQQGARASTIAKMTRTRFPQLLRSRVNLIARTESAKASAALTQARAEYLNLPCYVWRTAEDQRVRSSHKKMDGVVCFYANPPLPELFAGEASQGAYSAGEIYNCRCTQIVLLSVEDVKFPRRVAWGPNLRSMNKQDFKKLVVQHAA